MKISDRVLTNPGALANLERLVQEFEVSGGFIVLLEYCHLNSYPPQDVKGSAMEMTAIRGAHKDGYMDCIRDLKKLGELRQDNLDAKTPVKKPDYGALDKLLANKQISQEEYDQLQKEQE